MESGYFAASCSAIAELVMPCSKPGSGMGAPNIDQEHGSSTGNYTAFHNILGLIMASLSSEGYVDATGSWIAIAYRLWLDHCPSEINVSTLDWRGLFSGLQVSLAPPFPV